jgi:hypothetical protein
MTIQIHGSDHLTIEALSAPPERANAERENGCAAHAIIAMRET